MRRGPYITDLQAFGGIGGPRSRRRPATIRRRPSPARRESPRRPSKSGSKSDASTQAATYHKVKKGETLSSIAQSYNTTVANLKKNNANLSANLRAGEVLVISQVT